MRKKIAVIMSVLMVMVLTACGGEKVDDETSNKFISEAEEIIHLLNDGNYSEVVDAFADELKAELTEDQLREVEPVIDQSGEFEEVEKSSVEKTEGVYVVVIAGSYSEDDRVFTISFNEDEEVVGLYVK